METSDEKEYVYFFDEDEFQQYKQSCTDQESEEDTTDKSRPGRNSLLNISTYLNNTNVTDSNDQYILDLSTTKTERSSTIQNYVTPEECLSKCACLHTGLDESPTENKQNESSADNKCACLHTGLEESPTENKQNESTAENKQNESTTENKQNESIAHRNQDSNIDDNHGKNVEIHESDLHTEASCHTFTCRNDETKCYGSKENVQQDSVAELIDKGTHKTKNQQNVSQLTECAVTKKKEQFIDEHQSIIHSSPSVMESTQIEVMNKQSVINRNGHNIQNQTCLQNSWDETANNFVEKEIPQVQCNGSHTLTYAKIGVCSCNRDYMKGQNGGQVDEYRDNRSVGIIHNHSNVTHNLPLLQTNHHDVINDSESPSTNTYHNNVRNEMPLMNTSNNDVTKDLPIMNPYGNNVRKNMPLITKVLRDGTSFDINTQVTNSMHQSIVSGINSRINASCELDRDSTCEKNNHSKFHDDTSSKYYRSKCTIDLTNDNCPSYRTIHTRTQDANNSQMNREFEMSPYHQKQQTVTTESENIRCPKYDIFFAEILKHYLPVGNLSCGGLTCNKDYYSKKLEDITKSLVSGFGRAHTYFLERSKHVKKIKNADNLINNDLQYLCSHFMAELAHFTVEFSGCIRAFGILSKEHQKIQVTQSLLDMFVVYSAYWYSERSCDLLVEVYGLDVLKHRIIRVGPLGVLLHSLHKTTSSLKLLQLKKEEFILIAAMVLLSPDRSGLTKEAISHLRKLEEIACVTLKWNMLSVHGGAANTLFERTIRKLVDIRLFSELHLQSFLLSRIG